MALTGTLNQEGTRSAGGMRSHVGPSWRPPAQVASMKAKSASCGAPGIGHVQAMQKNGESAAPSSGFEPQPCPHLLAVRPQGAACPLCPHLSIGATTAFTLQGHPESQSMRCADSTAGTESLSTLPDWCGCHFSDADGHLCVSPLMMRPHTWPSTCCFCCLLCQPLGGPG